VACHDQVVLWFERNGTERDDSTSMLIFQLKPVNNDRQADHIYVSRASILSVANVRNQTGGSRGPHQHPIQNRAYAMHEFEPSGP
jgi:hypothetical protein